MNCVERKIIRIDLHNMVLKKLNKILILLALTVGVPIFSQMRMVDVDGKKITINLKTEKRNLIKILDNNSYCVYYIVDRKGFDFPVGLGTVALVNLIFFSKRHNKGILATFAQDLEHEKKSVYNITLISRHHENYMFVPSMMIVDKDFNYEYLMKYYYMPLPPPQSDIYTSHITIQDAKNYCNAKGMDVKGNMVYENMDDILNNIPEINKSEIANDCNPIFPEMDLRDFFPEKIIK